MNISQSFKQKLEDLKLEKKRCLDKEMKEENKYNAKVRKSINFERTKTKEKTELSNKIFEWRNNFLKTNEGQQIFNQSKKKLGVSCGAWGHEIPHFRGFGCWSRIYFVEKGIEYWSGYKWMSGQIIKFRKPRELAKQLQYEYLKNVCRKIKSADVFNDIIELNHESQ